MFKTVYIPTKVFDLNVIKVNARAIYSERENYYCDIDDIKKEYRSYKGIIKTVYEDSIRFISDDTHVNLYSDTEHHDKDIWLSPEDIDGYWVKLELDK